MKITFSNKDIAHAPKGLVRVRFVENNINRLMIDNGTETLEIGVGAYTSVTRRTFIILCRSIIQTAKQYKVKKIAVAVDQALFPQLAAVDAAEFGSIVAQNFVMANFEFTAFKSTPTEHSLEEAAICGNTSREVQSGYQNGQAIGNAVNSCRELANTPGSDMTPRLLAQAARKAAQETKAKVTVLGRKEMERHRMGGVLGVAKGSPEEPQFIVIEYRGGGKEKPIVLVGKGVTFDTGGLNLKPSNALYEMHMDMSGGAAVIHAVTLAARLKLPRNIIGLIPAVENMPSGTSYRPGDVLRSMSGKTIEVLDTDAEGRIILADALTYAAQYNPQLVVDIATLTGAALVALGTHASAIMTRDTALQKLFVELGEQSGDYVWPLPLWDEYKEYTRGTFGDISNIPSANARYGGAINGGIFLAHFTEAYPWVHIDMAPRMTTVPSDKLAKGAAGEPVRLLYRLLETYHAEVA